MSNTTTFEIAGMTCEACQKVIQKRLSKIKNVSQVTVDRATGITKLTAERQIDPSEITTALAETPYSFVGLVR